MAKSTSTLGSHSSAAKLSSSTQLDLKCNTSMKCTTKTKKNTFRASNQRAQKISITNKTNSNNNSTNLIDKRKRLAANARERKRMHLLNKAYDELRLRLVDAENKSKYDVLVQAKEYIQALATICEKFDKEKEFEHRHQQEQQQQQQGPQREQTIKSLGIKLTCKQEDFLFIKTSPLEVQQTPMDMTTIYDNSSCMSPLSTTSSVSSLNSHVSLNTNQIHSPINYRTTQQWAPIDYIKHNHCSNQQLQQYSTLYHL